MNLETSLGAMQLLSNMYRAGCLEQAGISKGDFERITGTTNWAANERARITTALYSLMVGSLDAQALPRTTLCAELLAAGISMFVNPVNAFTACHWLGSAPDCETLSRKSDVNNHNRTNHIQPDQIYALVVDLYRTDGRYICRQNFQKHTGLLLEKAEKTNAKA